MTQPKKQISNDTNTNLKILFGIILVLVILFVYMQVKPVYVTNDSQDVNIQDYTGEAFSFFLTKTLSQPILTSDITQNDLVINVDSTTNCTVFKAVDIYDDNYYWQGLVKSVTANTITLTSMVDKNFSTTNTVVKCGEWDLSTSDGSITPEVFYITPPTNSSWHIISTVFNCLDNTDMDSAKFCGGPALTNGISGSVTDGYSKDLFLIYNNNGFVLRGFNLNYITKAPAGVYGLNAKLLFRENYGAVIELNGDSGDTWRAINRDDLTDIEEIAITVNGHYVTD